MAKTARKTTSNVCIVESLDFMDEESRRESDTTGWQELLELAADQANLRTAIIERAAHQKLLKELAQALRQIDKGNEGVLEEKFTDLSDAVETWWDLLRPDELSFSSGVKARQRRRESSTAASGFILPPMRVPYVL